MGYEVYEIIWIRMVKVGRGCVRSGILEENAGNNQLVYKNFSRIINWFHECVKNMETTSVNRLTPLANRLVMLILGKRLDIRLIPINLSFLTIDWFTSVLPKPIFLMILSYHRGSYILHYDIYALI